MTHPSTTTGSSAWEDVRAELGFTEAEEADIGRRKNTMLAEVRAHRLAEVRKAHGLTQQQLADAIGISQERVSQIERSGLDSTVLATIAAYVEGLGGRIRVVADFGEEQVVLG
jgi:DNA-binding XRE family transcriptional regulator